VQFYADGTSPTVTFRSTDSVLTPTGFSISDNENDLKTLVIETGDDDKIEFLIQGADTGTANLRVWIEGYFGRVTGVGTQERTLTQTSLAVAANSSQTWNWTGWFNRGLITKFEIDETGGAGVSDYDVEIYGKDTFQAADMMYQAQGINPSAVFTDLLPFWYKDKDSTSEMHIKIINNDLSFAGTFSVTIEAEQFS
jgi:hypothetical protein